MILIAKRSVVYSDPMALTTAEIREVLAEIAPQLVGGRVQKVHQPHAEAVSLEIRSQGKTLTLYFSADPETARLHLLSKKPLNPSAPPPFCQLLRAHLEGARIERIEQVGNDRIVRLVMQRDGKPVTLVAELTGRTANLMLLDEAGAVKGQLRKGRQKIGDVYSAPVTKGHPVGAQFIAPKTDVINHAPTSEPFPFSDELERRYQEHDEARARARQLDAIKAGLRKTLKRTVKRIEALEADLAKGRSGRAPRPSQSQTTSTLRCPTSSCRWTRPRVPKAIWTTISGSIKSTRTPRRRSARAYRPLKLKRRPCASAWPRSTEMKLRRRKGIL